PPGKPEEKDPDDEPDVLWCLPGVGGEAYAVARRRGGWSGLVAAAEADTMLLSAAAAVSSADEAEHATITADRAKRKIAAILHEHYPVRLWDHDLGATDVRVLAVELEATRNATGDYERIEDALTDVTPSRGSATGELRGQSADGSMAVLDWTEAARHGAQRQVVVGLDLGAGTSTMLARDETDDFSGSVISSDGRVVVCVREVASTPTRPIDQVLWVVESGSRTGRPLAADWDAWPTPRAISPDSSTVYVTVDERGHAPLYAVDIATGARRRLTEDGSVASVALSRDGATLFAVISSYTDPGSIVAVDTASGEVRALRSPVHYPDLPGRCENVTAVAADGTALRGYLLLPNDADGPAPLALWVHGGPLSSWNSWSWRWCPWLLVSRGYAVLLPDPALSTGYGRDFVARGWGRWGAEPYTDLMAITDTICEHPAVDAARTVAMGGSFGGYMVNWIAGQTDRFAAIVSHASLWNLESFGPTTDAAWYWAREMSPEMMRDNSPHRHAHRITTPMLVVHGDKDYRVPISEGLALWWALTSNWDGPPGEMPHRFLYFPDENHWVLTPQHSRIWYETVFAFLAARVRGEPFVRPAGL
ncbi:MAG: prolyl oligopeptidase family serine peptidase, partial [Microlunatus sp.]|nr:prolyl oligopeptidase family serine peptidase [Microlunatus sp.]